MAAKIRAHYCSSIMGVVSGVLGGIDALNVALAELLAPSMSNLSLFKQTVYATCYLLYLTVSHPFPKI